MRKPFNALLGLLALLMPVCASVELLPPAKPRPVSLNKTALVAVSRIVALKVEVPAPPSRITVI